MRFLAWIDGDTKKTAAEKIAEAATVFNKRFGTPPNIVLVNAADQADVPGMTVQVNPYTRLGNFWLGYDPSLT